MNSSKYKRVYPYPVGIDLGTSNSCAAIKVGNEFKVIEAKEGVSKQGKTLASCVSFTDKETLVGDFAKNRLLVAPTETVYQSKRFMGTNKTWNVRGTTYRPQQIAAYILAKLKTDAEEQLEAEIKQAVITVPAQFNDMQRKATEDAAKIANLECIRLINEPTAAALAYDFEQDTSEQRILVADLGGGTFDVSILKCDNSVFEVIATGGDTKLGGKDIDDTMTTYVISQIKKLYDVVVTDVELIEKVRTAVETTKLTLSNVLNTDLIIPFLCLKGTQPVSVNIPYSRSLLQQQVRPIATKIELAIEQTLREASLTKGEIQKLLLVGGPMNMPIIRSVISKCVGREPSTKLNPNNCVAIGAAKQAAMLANPSSQQNILLLDVTPLSLGIEVEGGLMSTLIKKNAHIPTKSVQKYTTAEDNQRSVELRILQGERTMAADNKLLHTFKLENLPALKRGTAIIEVTFEINSSGVLEVTAEESTTKVKQKVSIVNNKNLSETDIERMIQEAEQNREKDELAKTKLETIHRAKTVILSVEDYIADSKLNLTEDEKTLCKGYISELETAISTDNVDTINEKMKEVEQKLMDLLATKNKSKNTTEPTQDSTTEDATVDTETTES